MSEFNRLERAFLKAADDFNKNDLDVLKRHTIREFLTARKAAMLELIKKGAKSIYVFSVCNKIGHFKDVDFKVFSSVFNELFADALKENENLKEIQQFTDAERAEFYKKDNANAGDNDKAKDKKEKPKNEVENPTSKNKTTTHKSAPSDSVPKTISIEFVDYPQYHHPLFRKACEYASSNGLIKEFVSLANAIKKSDLKDLDLWLQGFLPEQDSSVIYETLMAFFKKSWVEKPVFLALPQTMRNYISERSKQAQSLV